jgi:hypothetical protein
VAPRKLIRHTRTSLRKRADDEYRALDAIVRRLKPADFDRPAMREGAPVRWTVKEVIAHITAWKLRDVRRLSHDTGPVQPHEAPYGGDVHSVNGRIHARARRTPAKSIVAEHRAAHRAALTAIANAPAEDFARPHGPTWPYDLVGHVASHRRLHLDWLFAPARRADSATGPRSSLRSRRGANARRAARTR